MIHKNTKTLVNENTGADRIEIKELTADQLHDVSGGMRVSDAQAAAINYKFFSWEVKLYSLFHLW